MSGKYSEENLNIFIAWGYKMIFLPRVQSSLAPVLLGCIALRSYGFAVEAYPGGSGTNDIVKDYDLNIGRSAFNSGQKHIRRDNLSHT